LESVAVRAAGLPLAGTVRDDGLPLAGTAATVRRTVRCDDAAGAVVRLPVKGFLAERAGVVARGRLVARGVNVS
jgi:hypothetical protein